MSGGHDHSHEHRPAWLGFALIGLYGALVLLGWRYREPLASLAPLVYGVNPIAVLVLLGGYRIFRSAVGELLRLRASADLAVAIAAVAALAIGEYLAAAEVIFIMLIGGALEELAVDRTERSIRRIVELAPEVARVRRDGLEEDIPVGEVRAGDTVVVRAGERVPVDGVILGGRASLNEGTITGEPLAVSKAAGEEVHAGTLSEAGVLEIEATRVGSDTTLARIARLVQEARERKGAVQQRADRWAAWFVPVVLVAAAATWLVTKEPVRAVAVLVVACPCALVLATPTAVVAAIGRLAHEGVLLRGGGVLEALATADTVVFDKTGTLTRGEAALVEVLPAPGVSMQALLRWAASAEQPSEHAWGRLLVAHAARREIAPAPAEEFETRTGAGVVARVDGRTVVVGRAELLAREGCEGLEILRAAGEEYAERGAMLAYCAVDGRAIGLFVAHDPLRPEAARAVEDLREAGIAETLLLTGDHERAARAARHAAGITRHHADLLPHEKADVVRRLQDDGHTVVALGDGVNDAPMLATAAVGVAMGDVATDITAEAADVVLATPDLRRVPALIRFSRRAQATIRTNVFWFALLFNGIGMAAGAKGLLGPIGAAVFHQIASLLVVGNSLRLLTAGRLEERGRVARALGALGEQLHSAGRRLTSPWWRDVGRWAETRRAQLVRWGLSGLLGLYALSGVFAVGPAERAVVRRFGAQSGPPRQPGLHYRLPWPIERLVRVEPERVRVVEVGYRSRRAGEAAGGYEWESPHEAGQYRRAPEESLRLTGDENLLDVTVAVHYVVRNVHAYVFHVSDEGGLARAIAEAAVRDALGRSAAEAVMTDGRVELERRIARAAQSLLDRYESGLKVTDVRLLDVHPPVQVVAAFRDVASAAEEKRAEINRAEGYANEELPKARGRAAALCLGGEAQAVGRARRAAGDAARFRQLEQAHRGVANVVEIRLRLEALERALAGRRKLILSGRSGARRQMWLLDSRGLTLQPGEPVAPPRAGGDPPAEAPSPPATQPSPAAPNDGPEGARPRAATEGATP